ncbi:serine/threonine protein kinase [Streptomyces bambusae]|uniref:serine/threonine-protein kinase n=1 Tax=Streptomyces bambusae TaxID=1550616 RepID=UPI001CFCC52F|nr:serine/threonine-protein kinase [Streptomyces bambusae]MCB5167120.1 serine/threonine protein kinase [Streptomyces bambusae]
MTEVPSGERVVAGRYRLRGPLGRGRTGTVWQARDEVLGREVAVREVRAPAGADPAAARGVYERLERAARTAERVTHRGVVAVYDVAVEGGRPWIVMELVRGLSLAEVLAAGGPLAPQRAAHLGAQLLAALRAAHAAGVPHGDVTAGNVLVANDGRVVLGDFGLAAAADWAADGADPAAGGAEADLRALGALLYEAVEGGFGRPAAGGELPPPRRAGALEPVLDGLLRPDPAARLSAGEAERMLRVVGAGGAVRAADGPQGGTVEPAGPAAEADGSVASAARAASRPEQGGRGWPVPAAVAAAVALALVLVLLVWLLV